MAIHMSCSDRHVLADGWSEATSNTSPSRPQGGISPSRPQGNTISKSRSQGYATPSRPHGNDSQSRQQDYTSPSRQQGLYLSSRISRRVKMLLEAQRQAGRGNRARHHTLPNFTQRADADPWLDVLQAGNLGHSLEIEDLELR